MDGGKEARARHGLGAPLTGTERRLDVLIAGIDRLCDGVARLGDLLTPPAPAVEPEPAPEPEGPVAVELREPEAPPAPAKRSRKQR